MLAQTSKLKLFLIVGFALVMGAFVILKIGSLDRDGFGVEAASGRMTNICGGPHDAKSGIGNAQGSCGRCKNNGGGDASCTPQAGEVAVVIECASNVGSGTANWGFECAGPQGGVLTKTYTSGQTAKVSSHLNSNCMVQIDVFKGQAFGELVDFVVYFDPSRPNCGGGGFSEPPKTDTPVGTPTGDNTPGNGTPQEQCPDGQKYIRGDKGQDGLYQCSCGETTASGEPSYSTYNPELTLCVPLSSTQLQAQPQSIRDKCVGRPVGEKCYTDNIKINTYTTTLAVYVESSNSTDVCKRDNNLLSPGSPPASTIRYYSVRENISCSKVTQQRVSAYCSDDKNPGAECGTESIPTTGSISHYYREYSDSTDVCECYQKYTGNNLTQCLANLRTNQGSATNAGVSQQSSTMPGIGGNPPRGSSVVGFDSLEECRQGAPACSNGGTRIYEGRYINGTFTCTRSTVEQAHCIAALSETLQANLRDQGYYVMNEEGTNIPVYYFDSSEKCLIGPGAQEPDQPLPSQPPIPSPNEVPVGGLSVYEPGNNGGACYTINSSEVPGTCDFTSSNSCSTTTIKDGQTVNRTYYKEASSINKKNCCVANPNAWDTDEDIDSPVFRLSAGTKRCNEVYISRNYSSSSTGGTCNPNPGTIYLYNGRQDNDGAEPTSLEYYDTYKEINIGGTTYYSLNSTCSSGVASTTITAYEINPGLNKNCKKITINNPDAQVYQALSNQNMGVAVKDRVFYFTPVPGLGEANLGHCYHDTKDVWVNFGDKPTAEESCRQVGRSIYKYVKNLDQDLAKGWINGLSNEGFPDFGFYYKDQATCIACTGNGANCSLSTSSAVPKSIFSNKQVLGAETDNKTSISVDQSGRYQFFEGQTEIAEKDIVVDGKSLEIKLFRDTNLNGIRDNGEKYFTSDEYDNIKAGVEEKTTAIKFKLTAGWNLINIPLVDNRDSGNVKMASDLINYWRKQGAQINHVAKFSGGRFIMYTSRGDGKDYSANDFSLLPGEAIFVFNTLGNREVTFSGKEIKDSIALDLENGWNLVGIIAPNQSYTSETLLKKMEQFGVGADTLSQFEAGKYQSVVYEDQLLYGNNFNINDKKGYFLRVNSNAKRFTP